MFCVKLSAQSINNHIVGLVYNNHIIRTCLTYHAACKVEFQPFKTVVLTADVFQLLKKHFIFFVCFRLSQVSYFNLNLKLSFILLSD